MHNRHIIFAGNVQIIRLAKGLRNVPTRIPIDDNVLTIMGKLAVARSKVGQGQEREWALPAKVQTSFWEVLI